MGSLFKTPPAPTVKAPAPMAQESQLKKAARRKMESESASGGKSSTLLSSGGRETLGA